MSKFETFFIGAFSKAMIAAVLILVSVNGYLCFSNKVKEQKLINASEIIKQEKATNQQLSYQLEHAQRQINQYQAQVKALHENVLNHLQQAENRTNEIMQELQNVTTWSNQPVPTNIIRLFDKRTRAINQAHSPTLPNGSTVPNAADKTKK
ncbi:hypothetical protein B0186_05575 [Canicola haemoglobinophilus]|uniref:Hypothetical bacteriophage protein n=1 Tax=Canicola haemoglobinophilus TaxID=733 RepID=A0A1V4B167_9PAST|nr:hypothetical protein [Canicola haemoglobinophilus]OOS00654.1 hypothetical protein B0186_05575 [Canicola haemoglobinophilus]STO54356.1 hypothetical bacteriophage protein [Canicola haemoglobinophilus]STO60175.1 hypothetical bacteriophage protein [Canicola haemoglobinophilus]STO68890.1 hypothetical bacteriophage protein [Canicola haemoglobinophilus]